MPARFIKQSGLQAANSQAKIANLNVLETGMHLVTADIVIGFAATATLTKALKEKKLSQLQMYEFKKECCTMLATIVVKIQERNPLKYSFYRKLASLNPQVIVAEPDTAVRMFKQVLTKLFDTKWRTTKQVDGILTEYKSFVSDMKQFHCEHFAGFKFVEDRLNASFYNVLNTQRHVNVLGLQSSFF